MYENYAGVYFSYHLRPKFDYSPFVDERIPTTSDNSLYAIVIQGPIIAKFTSETVKFYKRNYPKANIILSTWKGEDVSGFENVHIILNDKPLYVGLRNINLQICSSLAGIKMAQSLKIPYVLKTRSDQRIYGLNCLTFMHNLLKCFGDRVIGIDFCSHLNSSFFFGDMFLFSSTQNLLDYFSCPLTTPERENLSIEILETEGFLAERYLFYEFLKRKNWDFELTYENYYRAIAKFCLSVGSEEIDLFWLKGRRFKEHRNQSYTRYGHTFPFKEWFNLYVKYSTKVVQQVNDGGSGNKTISS